MIISDETPVIALVVDRFTRRVIDSERFAYSYGLTSIFTRHDLSKVDIVFRSPESSNVTTDVAPEDDEPIMESPPTDDDIPF